MLTHEELREMDHEARNPIGSKPQTLVEESRSYPHSVIVKLSAVNIQLTEERDRLRKALEMFAEIGNWYCATVTFGDGSRLDSVLWGVNRIVPQELAANALEGKK